MTRRAFLAILCQALLLVCALSTRGAVFWLLFWTLGAMLAVGFASMVWTLRTLKVDCALDKERVTRGGQVNLDIVISHKCLLPVASVRLDIMAGSDSGDFALFVPVRPLIKNQIRQSIFYPHVGEYPSGVTGVWVQDVFGLFGRYRRLKRAENTLIVQPQIYLTEKLAFSPGDGDTESISRAFEDATLPTDLRAYQQGDELKKIHWKLSMRRKELLVRVYEQPARPDALLLIDCAPPMASEGLERSVRDAICEAAASLASVALDEGAPVRMPLLTETPTDINARRGEDIAQVLDALGRCAFDGAQQFERVLLLETRRMRRTGTTAIITSRMNPEIADMVLRIRRMGPKVRVMLAANVEDEAIAQLVRRLMRNDVEVEPISAELA